MSSESESEGISDIDGGDSYLSDDSSANIVPDTPEKNRKYVIRSLYKENNHNLLKQNIGNTCTEESVLKNHNSSTCSKSNGAVLTPSISLEPARNYTHSLYH